MRHAPPDQQGVLGEGRQIAGAPLCGHLGWQQLGPSAVSLPGVSVERPPILAMVFGPVALDEIEESEGAERGRGMAYWAIALGILNVVLSVLAAIGLILLLKS